MKPEYDVIVVGIGAMGSAALYEIAQRGARVLGIEQFDIPHAMGSSHGDSRLIRLCYYEHPDYVPLLHRSYERWRELERIANRKLLYLTGGLYMGPPDAPGNEFVLGCVHAAQTHDLPHELLSASEARSRWPQFTLPDDYEVMHEPNAGFLLSEQIIATYVKLALDHGADIKVRQRVQSWDATESGVTVKTTAGTHTARHVVFTAGAWLPVLIGDLNVELTVTRQVLGWVWPKKPELFNVDRFPIWAINTPQNTLYYGFPLMPQDAPTTIPGLKLAHHVPAELTTADSINREAQVEEQSEFRPCLEQFIPEGNGQLLSLRVCMYTNTPDSHFIIDHHPRYKNVTIAGGLCGHGFKFASVMGVILADLALDGETSQPIGFLGLDRFRESAAMA